MGAVTIFGFWKRFRSGLGRTYPRFVLLSPERNQFQRPKIVTVPTRPQNLNSVVTHIQILKYYSTLVQTNASLLQSFHEQFDMTPWYAWHDSFIRVTWLIHTCDMTHSYVWHDSFIRVTWLIHTCDMTHSYMWHDSFIRVTWLIHTCDMTHLYVWHDSFVHVTWLIHTCDMTHPYLSRPQETCVCMSRVINICDMTHPYMWHDSSIHMIWLINTC